MINKNDLKYYMRVAEMTAERSHAVRRKVGAVVVSIDRVMAGGYNGTPSGWDNCCEIEHPDGTLTTKAEVIHAEANALFKFLNNGVSTKGSAMFITLSPCLECAKALHLASVAEVYYRDEYRDLTGVEFLVRNGVKVQRIID
jgi:dCMP deaminase